MIGIGLPQLCDCGPSHIRDMAGFLNSAEELGYQSVWVADGPVSQPMIDPLVALTTAAAHTTTLRIGSNVLVLPRYHPVLLARMIASVDQLSGGRLTLGLGIGGNTGLEASLTDSDQGVSHRFHQTIADLRKLWNGAPFDGGTFGSRPLAGLCAGPRPAQDPLPIWIGASGPNALRRAAQNADGWICSGRADLARFTELAATIRADRATSEARNPFTIAKRCYVAIEQRPEDIDRWFRVATGGPAPSDQVVITGDCATVEARLHEFRLAGAEELMIQPVGRSERAQMEALADAGAVRRLARALR